MKFDALEKFKTAAVEYYSVLNSFVKNRFENYVHLYDEMITNHVNANVYTSLSEYLSYSENALDQETSEFIYEKRNLYSKDNSFIITTKFFETNLYNSILPFPIKDHLKVTFFESYKSLTDEIRLNVINEINSPSLNLYFDEIILQIGEINDRFYQVECYSKINENFENILSSFFKSYVPFDEKIYDESEHVKVTISDHLNFLDVETAENDYSESKDFEFSPRSNVDFCFDEINEIIYLVEQMKIVNSPKINDTKQPNLLAPVVKLNWLGSPTLFGHIFYELAEKGFIEFPETNGDRSYKKYAAICMELFNFNSTKGYIEKSLNPEKCDLSDTKIKKIKIPNIKDLQ